VPAARRTAAAAAAPAGSSLRAMRGRVAQQIQGMDLRDEMAWIRSDIGRLTVLAVAGFAILIVLAIVLPMFNL
jgi:type II secretory pathway component PulF